MVHCILCGTGNDVTARYCAGLGCGADLVGLREGDPTRAVQVYGDPAEAEADAGELVETTLTIRNAGSEPDRYVLELRRDIGDRVTVRGNSAPGGLAPGETCQWTVRYAVPHDRAPDAGVLDIPLRVVSTHDRRVAAVTLFSVHPADAAPLDAVPFPVPRGDSRAGHRARRRARNTQFAAAGAVAAVAVVAALIVGMASAGSGGGDRDAPTRQAAPATTPRLPVGESPPPGNEGIPTELPSHPSTAPSTTDGTASATVTTRPPSTRSPGASASGTKSGAPGPATRPGGGATTPPPVPWPPVPSGPGTGTPSTPPGSQGPSPSASPSSEPPSTVPVPNVVGSGYTEARAVLESAGFEVGASGSGPCRGDLSAAGCVVVSQSPTGSAPAGSEVSLRVASRQDGD
ncbi:MAG TPA: PASTA domain-containing protein [Yinghuangia sp.]|nr:PASTA domain-containing protein [Yinghuangia sp.]